MTQAELLSFAIKSLDRLAIPYMVVGSFTSGVYGEPRLTRDIDIVIDVSVGQISSLCDAFPPEDFYVSREAARAAAFQRTQFNVVHPASGNKIDFMLSRIDPWGVEQLLRRQKVPLLEGISAFVARPEDIILSKMLYYHEGGSEKHLRDIAGILRTTGAAVDREYVAVRAERFGISDIWAAVQTRSAENP